MIGFAHVFLAVKPSGKVFAFICASLMAVGYTILAAWHCAIPMFAYINRMQPDGRNPIAHEGWKYLEFIGFCGFVPAFLGLVLLPILILFRTSLYPKWFCILTPLAFYAMGQATFPMLPAPIGGYLVSGNGSLSLLFFFSLSTALLWSGGNPVPSSQSAS